MPCASDPNLETKPEAMKTRYYDLFQSECTSQANGRFSDFLHPMTKDLESAPLETFARRSICRSISSLFRRHWSTRFP